MAELTKAEIMLNQVTKSNRLINYLRFCKDHPIPPPVRLDLLPSTKASIKAYQDGVQTFIDRLTAQNEKAVSLVRQIPDGEVQLVLQLRYGLLDNATKKMPWMDIPPLMNYELETLYRRHRKGIDYLNMLLEQKAPDRL
ncbi:hypothetical protein [Intestinimonas massiliensis (ex Afouda et al. 2020)]|uniref:DUF1492 domain-containing protein n=1 Tax=Intestinimonas massiliensis (ex Afouda et al. 2020) TaxID=1673721 RepID=A0ABS9M5T7_9FIRM|nr:hypothetical protein [Intestinimonas massiliensis (ex Afouda et al. 2020)]MCG4526158.1 hypothetical protein [Intestinimonas massiliensis (ex Afouda et al. 2020)]